MFQKRPFLPYASKSPLSGPSESGYLLTQRYCYDSCFGIDSRSLDPKSNWPERPHPNTQQVNCFPQGGTL
ncbi:hypothetical protein SCLCIDRAFT_1213040, partial [Scleroderma citrinum Foug A]